MRGEAVQEDREREQWNREQDRRNHGETPTSGVERPSPPRRIPQPPTQPSPSPSPPSNDTEGNPSPPPSRGESGRPWIADETGDSGTSESDGEDVTDWILHLLSIANYVDRNMGPEEAPTGQDPPESGSEGNDAEGDADEEPVSPNPPAPPPAPPAAPPPAPKESGSDDGSGTGASDDTDGDGTTNDGSGSAGETPAPEGSRPERSEARNTVTRPGASGPAVDFGPDAYERANSRREAGVAPYTNPGVDPGRDSDEHRTGYGRHKPILANPSVDPVPRRLVTAHAAVPRSANLGRLELQLHITSAGILNFRLLARRERTSTD